MTLKTQVVTHELSVRRQRFLCRAPHDVCFEHTYSRALGCGHLSGFNMLVPGRTHILSCLLQVLPQQRILLSEFRKKSKSLVLLFHLLLSPGLGSGGHGSLREYILSHPVLGGLFREWMGWVHDIWLEEELDLSKCPRWTTLSFKVPERTIWRESCQDNRHVFYSETEPWIPMCEPLRVAWRRWQSFLFGLVMKAEMLVAQSCLALCSPPGFSVCGIPQATILEWWPHHLPHLTLSSPLPASISLFSMSVSPSRPYK